jgi:hypothetical protein
MRYLGLALILLSTAAWAQRAYPARDDCELIVRELQMRPPSYGDPSRANYDWGSYLGFCEKPPWNRIIGADDVNEVAKVLHPGMFR